MASTFEFIDVLTTQKDGSEFERSFREIYSFKLEQRKQNIIIECSFSDLSKTIKSHMFLICFYVSEIYPFSTVHICPLYSFLDVLYSFGIETLRIGRTKKKHDKFI